MDLSLRKNIAAFSLLAILASFMVVGTATAAAADVYDDVDGTEWYSADVTWGLDNGVLDETQAYFRAGDNASRAEFFKMTAAGAGIPEAACDETLFPDLDANHWGCGWVTALAEAGIVSGDGSGSETPGYVRPNDNVLRAEAAKVVVEAYGLTGTSMGTDYFTDVESGAWYDEYMGTARDNCVFQGVGGGSTIEPGRNIVRAEAIAVVNRGANPTTDCSSVVVETGALNVAVSPSTPAAVFIPQNGANIPYSVFQFSASSEEAVNVDQIIITRTGLGLPGDFKNLKLYVDGVQVGGEKTVNTTSNTATFNLSSTPIMVPAGGSVLVEVRGDMNGVTGSQNQLCIATSDDVMAYGDASGEMVAVGGAFAACGEAMSTTSAVVGTLTYTVTQPSTSEINVGDVDVAMTKVKMDMAVEDVNVNRVTFKQTGSAGMEDFGNLALWMSGSMYADNYSWSGDFLTFDLSDNPINIAKGNSKTVELHTDIVGGLSSTANFDIYRDWHIEGTGTVYGYGVNVAEAGASVTPTARNIVGGNVAFSLSANNPVTGDVKKGANDFDFTRFNVSTGGDGVSVRKISLTVTGTDFNDIDDVKIWTKNSAGDWYVVAGPNDITVALPLTVSFTDTFDIPAGVTQEFMITADIANAATAGDVYDIDVASVNLAANTELEYLSDGTPVNVVTEVTGGALNGNVMTVNTPTLNASLAATPGAKSYVRNTINKDIVAFDLAASTADDLRVTSLTVTCTDTSEVGALAIDGLDNDADGFTDETSSCHTAFSSLTLYEKSTMDKLDPSARSMSDGGINDTVTFSTNYTIPAGTTARVLVQSNLSSSAVGDDYWFEIAAGGLSVEDSDSSAATVTGLPTGPNTVTVAPNGTTSNQGVTEASLQSRIVQGLSADEPVLKVKFSADELEAWYIKKLRFNLPVGSDADVTSVKVKYLDNYGAAKEATGTVSGNLVQFNGLNVYVPAGGNQTVDVLISMGDVTVGGAVAGDLLQLCLNADNAIGTGCAIAAVVTPPLIYEAIGASSATSITAGTDAISNVLRLAKSYPMVKRNELSTALSNGEKQLHSATIEAKGDMSVKQLCYEVNDSFAAAPAAGVGTFKLFRGTESTDLVTAGEVTITAGAALCGGAGTNDVLVQWVAGEDQMANGDLTTYILKGTVTGALSGDSINTTLLGDVDDGALNSNRGVVLAATPYTLTDAALAPTNAYFVWSDLSKTPHDSTEAGGTSTDFLDGYLVDGLASAGGQVLSL